MTNKFKPGDLVYYVHNNGDKEPCIVNEVRTNESMWVTWQKDGFTNLMPTYRFTKEKGNEKEK